MHSSIGDLPSRTNDVGAFDIQSKCKMYGQTFAQGGVKRKSIVKYHVKVLYFLLSIDRDRIF